MVQVVLFLAVSLSELFPSTRVPATDRVSEQLCVWSQGEQRSREGLAW
jgi:hypothetical protein